MRHLLTGGAFAVAAVVFAMLVFAMLPAAAQTFEGSVATIGTQWKPSDGNLASYVGNGYRVVGVTQQLTPSDRGIVNLTSYFLQKETSFVRCNELTVPPPAAVAAVRGKEVRTNAKPVAPTVVLGCADAVNPSPVPFSTRPVAGLETILPGQ